MAAIQAGQPSPCLRQLRQLGLIEWDAKSMQSDRSDDRPTAPGSGGCIPATCFKLCCPVPRRRSGMAHGRNCSAMALPDRPAAREVVPQPSLF